MKSGQFYGIINVDQILSVLYITLVVSLFLKVLLLNKHIKQFGGKFTMKKNIKKIAAVIALVLIVVGIILICWKHPVLGAIAITIAVCTLALLAFTWMIAPPEPKAQKRKKGQKKQQRRKNKVEDEEFEEVEDDKSSVVINMVTNAIRGVCKKLDPHRLTKVRVNDKYLDDFVENLEILGQEFEDSEIEATDFGVCLFFALMNEGKVVAKDPEDDELAEDINFRVALISAITLIINANLLDEKVDPENFKMMYPNITLPKETYENVKNTMVEVYEKECSLKTVSHIFNLILETKQIEVEEIK